MFLGGREHIEDATANGELAALLDELHARVRGGGEGVDDLAEVGGPTGPQRDRFQVTKALDLRLEHGTDGGHDDGDRAGLRVVGARVGEAAQDGEATAHGVAAGAEPLVREGLPGRVVHDALRGEQRAQGRGQVLRLTARRRHREDRAAGLAGQGGDREGAGRGRADQVDVHAVAVCGRGDRFREGGVLDDGVEQTVQAHSGAAFVRGWATRIARRGLGAGGSPAYDDAVTDVGACGQPQPGGNVRKVDDLRRTDSLRKVDNLRRAGGSRPHPRTPLAPSSLTPSNLRPSPFPPVPAPSRPSLSVPARSCTPPANGSARPDS
ncbi:hypothetical protein SALBM311S_06830 [Streptomyces alboniger]